MSKKISKRYLKLILKRIKQRRLFIISVVTAFLFFLFFRVIYINISEGKEYEKNVLEQQGHQSTSIPYRRGDILDSNGTILATTIKEYNIILEPYNILSNKGMYRKDTIAALVKYLGADESEINEILNNPNNANSFYYVLLEGVSYEAVNELKNFQKSDKGENVIGIYYQERYKREYPNGSLACHVLGFSGYNNLGNGGVEGAYDEYLNGIEGREYSYLAEDYSVIRTVEKATNGYNVVTTIDANIQNIVEKKCKEYEVSEGAKNVSVLVMDPNNSEVLAMYNSRGFDPNEPGNLDNIMYQFDSKMSDEEKRAKIATMTDAQTSNALGQVWKNFIISDTFEPGSTYKTFTIAGALEENVINEDYSFFCDGGEKVAEYYIKCHLDGGHGQINLSQALEGSCNDSMMDISKKEGAAIFDKYQVLFGFGQKTNIDIAGEQSDDDYSTLVYHKETLNETELATSSFGQGVSVTMMQVATAFCSVINGGYYYEPRVGKKIIDEKGNLIKSFDSVLVRRTISERVSNDLKEYLFQVVERGTGKRAAVEGYSIGGKTGTAEKLPRNNGKYIISFIGFAPIENPEVVIYVIVDEPNVEDQSNSGAASLVFASIASELLPYLNIYKTNDNYDLDKATAVDEATGPIFNGAVPANGGLAGDQANTNNQDPNQENKKEDTKEDTTEDTTEDTQENTQENTTEDSATSNIMDSEGNPVTGVDLSNYQEPTYDAEGNIIYHQSYTNENGDEVYY